MFDFVRNNTRVLFFVLVLLIIPSFVFLGVQGYGQFREGTEVVAKVAGQQITAAELDMAHRNQIERMRQQMPNVDVRMLDTPEMRAQTLEAMLRERVVAVAADKMHLLTSDERLQRRFATDPQYAFLRNPDGSVNKEILGMQGMSSDMFAERLRREFSLRQVVEGVAGTVVASKAVSDLSLDAFLEQREIQVRRFDVREHIGKVNPSDADLQAYYQDAANAAQFQAPERARIEYVVLDVQSLRRGISINEEDLRTYYRENAARYSTREERRASHIFLEPGADRAATRAKAESLLAELRKNPAAFADLARKHSQDPGSANSGGDLGFLARGNVDEALDKAIFALKTGEISDVVEGGFGFHIVRVSEVRGGSQKPFESVRGEIEEEVRAQLVQRRYAEAAEQFSNMVYEQADSLDPVAEKLQLQVQRDVTVMRTPAPGAAGPLASPKFLEAVFSADTLRNKRNTEAIEIGASQLAAARVVEHQPARQIPFDEVKDRVRVLVVARQAAELARKEGEASLAAWKQASDAAQLGNAVSVSRLQPNQQDSRVVEAALKANAAQLPAWIGVDLGNQGYAVVRVARVTGREPVPGGDEQLRSQYAQAWGAAETQAYYAALKNRFKAEVTARPRSSENR